MSIHQNLKADLANLNINKRVTSNKRKHIQGEKKPNELSEKVKLSTKGNNFLLSKMCFADNGGYQFFSVFTPTLDNNKKSY